jgi:hypothetical protein
MLRISAGYQLRDKLTSDMFEIDAKFADSNIAREKLLVNPFTQTSLKISGNRKKGEVSKNQSVSISLR